MARNRLNNLLVALQSFELAGLEDSLVLVRGRRLLHFPEHVGHSSVEAHWGNQLDGGAQSSFGVDEVALVEINLESQLGLVVGVEGAQVLRERARGACVVQHAAEAGEVGALLVLGVDVGEGGVGLVEGGVGVKVNHGSESSESGFFPHLHALLVTPVQI